VTLDAIGPGELKLVTAWSPRREIGDEIERTLRAKVRPEDVRRLWNSTFVVYTAASHAEIRDWLAASLHEDEGVFVATFEQWSAYGGGAVPRTWLLRRGH
jgi:hypothetical protein